MTRTMKKKLSRRKKLAIILVAMSIGLVIGFIYSVILRIQQNNEMIAEGCRADQYDILGLPSRWQCPVNLPITAV